jgi:hypothetical protein
MSRPCYGIFSEREWPHVLELADREAVNVSELIRRAVQIYGEAHGVVLRFDERCDYWQRTRRSRGAV